MGTARRPRKPNCTALQKAVRVAEDNDWGPQTSKALSIAEHASDGQFPFGVKATQEVVGAYVDGWWGPASKQATRETVTNVQIALTAMGFFAYADGVWGKQTESAFYEARDSHHPYEVPGAPDD
jgi:hypothetical protein